MVHKTQTQDDHRNSSTWFKGYQGPTLEPALGLGLVCLPLGGRAYAYGTQPDSAWTGYMGTHHILHPWEEQEGSGAL